MAPWMQFSIIFISLLVSVNFVIALYHLFKLAKHQKKEIEKVQVGPGTLHARFNYLIDELNKRFPVIGIGYSAAPPEMLLLKEIDETMKMFSTIERNKAMEAILRECPTDGSDAEIILRRAWERVRQLPEHPTTSL